MQFWLFNSELRKKLREYEEYVKCMEGAILTHAKDIAKSADELNTENNKLCESANTYAKSSSAYVENFRSACFPQLYSMIERKYNEICEVLGEIYEAQFSYKDLKEQGLLRARVYISKITKSNYWDNDQWRLLIGYQTIRNAVVHNGSQLKDSDIGKVTMVSGVKLERNNLFFDENFLPAFIDFVDQHLSELINTASRDAEIWDFR